MPVRSCMHTQPFLCRVDLKNKTDRLRLACINWHACSSDSRNCKLYACAYVRPDWLVWNKGNQRLCSDAHECCFVWAHQPGLRPSMRCSEWGIKAQVKDKTAVLFLARQPGRNWKTGLRLLVSKKNWKTGLLVSKKKKDCLFPIHESPTIDTSSFFCDKIKFQ